MRSSLITALRSITSSPPGRPSSDEFCDWKEWECKQRSPHQAPGHEGLAISFELQIPLVLASTSAQSCEVSKREKVLCMEHRCDVELLEPEPPQKSSSDLGSRSQSSTTVASSSCSLEILDSDWGGSVAWQQGSKLMQILPEHCSDLSSGLCTEQAHCSPGEQEGQEACARIPSLKDAPTRPMHASHTAFCFQRLHHSQQGDFNCKRKTQKDKPAVQAFSMLPRYL